MSNETKHTRGEAVNGERGILIDGALVGRGYGDTGEQANLNAARLCAGWNLLNRLEEMGVTAEQAVLHIKASLRQNAIIAAIESGKEIRLKKP